MTNSLLYENYFETDEGEKKIVQTFNWINDLNVNQMHETHTMLDALRLQLKVKCSFLHL